MSFNETRFTTSSVPSQMHKWVQQAIEQGNVFIVTPEIVMADVIVVALSIQESLDIKRIYSEKGRKSISHYKSEIQEIGRSLNKTKGVPLMQGFLRLYIPERDWRVIDCIWDGIGEWQW